MPLFLFYLFRFFGENIDKYNRIALFAGRQTMRIIKVITVFPLEVVGPIMFQKKKKKKQDFECVLSQKYQIA